MATPRQNSPSGPAGLTNAAIADAFNEIADILDIEGDNPFRIRAYRNAARLMAGLPDEAAALLRRGDDLVKLPGVGKDLAQKITDLVNTGSTPMLDELRKKLPPAVVQMLRVPGLGPKRVKLLYDKLRIKTIDDLELAVQSGKLRTLGGFGEKTEQNLIQALKLQAGTAPPKRIRLAAAAQQAEPLVAYLKKLPGIGRITIAGSYRRARQMIGDLDIVATARNPERIISAFSEYPEVARVLGSGPTRGTVVLRSGLQVDIRVVPAKSFGAALVYFTGSQAHCIAIRKLALKRKLKINEYGVFKGERSIAGDTEEAVYRAIGLAMIPPELREDAGEITAAQNERLPDLVEPRNICGDLHFGTTEGRTTVRDMALAAKAAGYAYVAIADRDPEPAEIERQMAEIDALDKEKIGVTVLKGVEVDILADGQLSLPDAVLAKLDLVIAAPHPGQAPTTEQILRALDNPRVTILAQPWRHRVGDEAGAGLDMGKIAAKVRERGCVLELNVHPDRLDLGEAHWRVIKDAGVPVSVTSGARHPDELSLMALAVGQARRAWLGSGQILNAQRLAALRTTLGGAGRNK
jgi:DNA polymerase (family X)